MIHRIGKKNFNIFAFDLESHNDSESIAKGETSMWLGCLINEKNSVEDESSYLYSINELLDRLEELSTPKRKHGENKPCKNVCVFIYNLSFEWSFILPVMLQDYGFTFKEKFEDEDEFVFNSVSTKSCSSVWSANLKFHKKSGIVVFRDLAKLFGGGLKNVAKSFHLPTQKGEIDYRLNRLHNHIVTKEEKEYCFKDTRILIDILEKIIDDKDFWNSISISSYSMRKMIKTGYPRYLRPYKQFRKEYPELDKAETDMLRMGVAGGITYAPKRWQFKTITEKILHIDAHQMHPSSAYFNLFPYGKGEYFTGEPPFSFSMKIHLCHIRVSYDFVKLHSIIQLIGIDFVYDRELVVWDFEIPTMYKCYEGLIIQYIDGYAYSIKVLPWRKYYAHNYRERLKAKAVKDEYNTMLYKLLNNSSYGKLLENPHNYIIKNTLDSYGIINSLVEEKSEEEQRLNAKYTYLPVGSCIPAYSRVCLIETALKFGWEKICYFDTDSIFVIYDKESEKVWNTINQEDFLGGWGLEEIIDKAQFTAPKRYKTETNGKATIKAGGFNFKDYIEGKAHEQKIDPNSYEVTFDEINLVNSSWKVQRAFRCKGGTLIEFETKEIKVADKYLTTYERNVNMLLDDME